MNANMAEHIYRNLGLDLVRATEAAALAAGRWMGLGQPTEADLAANLSMYEAICAMDVNCRIVQAEYNAQTMDSPLQNNLTIGGGSGPEMDLSVDPIDGCSLLAQGRSGAISVAAIAPRGAIWSPQIAEYMEKIVVNRDVAQHLVPECLDAPAAWTLALIARAKEKAVRNLTVFVLDRPRHANLIEEIRTAGARVMLRGDGDIAGALLAAYPDDYVDVLIGIGGTTEGILASCAVRALGGEMLARLAPQSADEKAAVEEAGLDSQAILRCGDMVSSEKIFFAATGITDGPLLAGVRYRRNVSETQSLVLRGEFGTRRIIQAEHQVIL